MKIFIAILAFTSVHSVSASFGCNVIDYTVYEPVLNYAVCSGQGECVANFTCVCNDGWTGRSDMLNTEGIDCQINEIAIIVLWIVNIVQTVYSAVKSFPLVRTRYATFTERKAALQKRGRSESILKSRGLVASLMLMTLGFPSMAATGLLRIAKTDERVGVTFGMTFMFAAVKTIFYISNWLYSPALLTSLLKGTNYRKARVNQLIRINEIGSFSIMCMSITAGLIPFAGLAGEGELGSAEKGAYAGYLSLQSLTMALYFILFTFMSINIATVLDASIKITRSKDTVELRKKLLAMTKSGQTQTVLQIVIYCSFLFWPVLWNKHDYFLPISWLAFNKLGRECCATVIRKGGSRSGSSKKLSPSRNLGSSSNSFEVSGDAENFEMSKDFPSNREISNRELATETVTGQTEEMI